MRTAHSLNSGQFVRRQRALRGISERLALPWPKPKPHLSLQKDVLLQLDVPGPDPESNLSLKRTSEAHTNPDAIIHQDLLVHPLPVGMYSVVPSVHLYTMTLKSVSVVKMRLASLVPQYCQTRGI